jgi:hypothetical protein
LIPFSTRHLEAFTTLLLALFLRISEFQSRFLNSWPEKADGRTVEVL